MTQASQEAPATLPLGAPSALRQWPAMLYAAAVFAFLSILAGIKSPGFLEADACTHYLYSRFSWHEHYLLTDVWGRPFCTFIYSLAANLGHRTGVRIFSTLMALGIALITYRIARNQGYRWPGLAFIFVLGQPVLFLHSFSELTELPFALLLALGFWAYQARRWMLMALVVGLMPTARPEGLEFLRLAAAALLLHRRLRWLPLLVVPMAMWSASGWYLHGMAQPWHMKWWHWLCEHWPYATESVYDRGPLLLFSRKNDRTFAFSFLLRLPAVVSPLAFPALFLGIWRSCRLTARVGPLTPESPRPAGPGILDFASPRGHATWRTASYVFRLVAAIARSAWAALFGPDHRIRCDWLIALIPLSILAVHSVLWWRGKMASNGELRYILVAAPMWGLLVARGWAWAFRRLRWQSPMGLAGLAVLLPAFVNAVYKVVPLSLSKEGVRSREVAEWYASPACSWKAQYPKLLSTVRDVYYFLDQSPTDHERSAEWHPRTIQTDQQGKNRGIILIWDPIYGMYNSNSELKLSAEKVEAAGWVPVKLFTRKTLPVTRKSAIDRVARQFQTDELGDWIIFLSPYDATGAPTDRSLRIPIPATRPAE